MTKEEAVKKLEALTLEIDQAGFMLGTQMVITEKTTIEEAKKRLHVLDKKK